MNDQIKQITKSELIKGLKDSPDTYDINKDFILHITYENWGSSVMIMEKKGNAYAHVYWFYDDETTIYFEGLSVDENARKQGIGTKLLKIFEQIGIHLGATYACLQVNKTKWVYERYKRQGYKYLSDSEEEKNNVWLRKPLK